MSTTMPTSPGPRTSKIASLVNNMMNVTHSQRRIATTRGGQRWKITLNYAPATRDEITDLWTFINSQSGQAGAFYFDLPNLPHRGTMSGAPVVDGENQTGRTLATAGWPANSGGVLRVGDFIRLTGHYKTYQVTADVTADADGKALVPIFPPLEDTPFDGAVLVSDNRLRVALLSDIAEVDISQVLHFGLNLELVEVLV